MVYTCKYESPIGDILLAADEIGLTGLWFEGEKYFANTLPDERISQETDILTEAKKMAGCIFFRRRTDVYSASSPCGFNISTERMADFIADPVRKNNHLRRDCP